MVSASVSLPESLHLPLLGTEFGSRESLVLLAILAGLKGNVESVEILRVVAIHRRAGAHIRHWAGRSRSSKSDLRELGRGDLVHSRRQFIGGAVVRRVPGAVEWRSVWLARRPQR